MQDLPEKERGQTEHTTAVDELGVTDTSETITEPVPVLDEDPERVVEQYACVVPIKKSNGLPPLSLLACTITEWLEFAQNQPNSAPASNDRTALWGFYQQQALEHYSLGDALQPAANRAGAQWRQELTHEARKLSPGRPKLAVDAQEGLLSGENAVLKISSYLGQGSSFQVPLWHSGLWVTFKAPSLAELCELDRQIVLEKETAGRRTHGTAFSNDSVYTNALVIDFALQHVLACTVENWTVDLLKQLIRQPDMHILAWGLAACIYPEGYDFAQPCTADMEKCTHVTLEKLKLNRMFWVDSTRINDEQRKFMANPKRRTPQEILDYQDKFAPSTKNIVELSEKVSFVLRTPTIEQHMTSGHRWIGDIEETVERSFGIKLQGGQRDRYIQQQATASTLRQFGHWVKEVVITEEDGTQSRVEDVETIENLLTTLCATAEHVDKLLNGFQTYANDQLVGLVGIPNYACPKCGAVHPQTGTPSKHLLVLDAISTFFTLLRSQAAITKTDDDI